MRHLSGVVGSVAGSPLLKPGRWGIFRSRPAYPRLAYRDVLHMRSGLYSVPCLAWELYTLVNGICHFLS